MELLITKLIPLIVILGIGILLQKIKTFTDEIVTGLKYIIINISLPAVLFTTFIKAPLKPEYAVLFVLMFLFCSVLYGFGRLYQKALKLKYTGEFFTGFEFGMVGVALFTSLWGVDRLAVVVLIALGHEIFIWFVYIPMLEYKNTGHIKIKKYLQSFITTPIIIAIISGITVNIFNLYPIIEGFIVGQGFIATLSMLVPITGPLILIVVGYSIRLGNIKWNQTLVFVGIRLVTVLIVGTGIYYAITAITTEIDSEFGILFFGFILLPPPFIFPLFIEKNQEELTFFSNAVSIYTLLSFLGFIVLMLL